MNRINEFADLPITTRPPKVGAFDTRRVVNSLKYSDMSNFQLTDANKLKEYKSAKASVFTASGSLKAYCKALGIADGRNEVIPMGKYAIIRDLDSGLSTTIALSKKFEEQFDGDVSTIMVGLFPPNEKGEVTPCGYVQSTAGSGFTV